MSSVYSSNNVKVTLQTIKEAKDAKPAVTERVPVPIKKGVKRKKSDPEYTDRVVTPAVEAIAGSYQVHGGSSNGVARIWEFDDNIGETTQKTVDSLVASGCVVVDTKREDSAIDSLSNKSKN